MSHNDSGKVVPHLCKCAQATKHYNSVTANGWCYTASVDDHGPGWKKRQITAVFMTKVIWCWLVYMISISSSPNILTDVSDYFLPARRYARAGLSDSNVSGCLSVTAGIVSKRKQLALWFLHHLIAHWYRSLTRYDSSKNSQGVTPSEGDFWDRWVRTGDFLTYKPPYLWNGARYNQGYYWTLIGNRIRAFDWYNNERPWMTLNWPSTAITRFFYITHLSFGAHHENTNEHGH